MVEEALDLDTADLSLYNEVFLINEDDENQESQRGNNNESSHLNSFGGYLKRTTNFGVNLDFQEQASREEIRLRKYNRINVN